MTSPVVTLTLNPALDVASQVDVVAPTHKLRCDAPRTDPGGGGINVSRVCQRLGVPTIAVLPLGGSVGTRIAELLAAEAIDTRAVPIDAETRENITVHEASTGHQYRFVFPGAPLSPAELDDCVAQVVEQAAASRCVVISGSMPNDEAVDILSPLVASLDGVRVLVDTSGPALAAALSSGAYLIKPSARELAALVDRPLHTESDIESAAKELLESSNVDVIVVSIGAGGAIAVTHDQTIRLRAPTVQVKSAVGAGDSMVGGIAVGIQKDLPLVEALALGIAAGTAAVMSEGTMLCSAEDVSALRGYVVVDE